MPLNEKELQQIKDEAEKLYPTISMNECTGPIDYQKKNSRQKEIRQAYIAGATKDREKTNELVEKSTAFMSTIPITNHNYYLVGFDKALEELKEALTNYQNSTP